MSGSGISWAIWKSAPRCRQITTPAPHHSVFYRTDALPAAQPTASKHWRHIFVHNKQSFSINQWFIYFGSITVGLVQIDNVVTLCTLSKYWKDISANVILFQFIGFPKAFIIVCWPSYVFLSFSSLVIIMSTWVWPLYVLFFRRPNWAAVIAVMTTEAWVELKTVLIDLKIQILI